MIPAPSKPGSKSKTTAIKLSEIMTDSDEIPDLLKMPLPGDAEFPEFAFNLTARIAKKLSEKGWRFIPAKGPNGHYFEGRGPGGSRIISTQKDTQEAALLTALRQAHSIQFPA